jgi:hypothetical protein
MKRWLWLPGVLALVGVAALILDAVHKPAPETADILAVGQTYVFTTGDLTIIGEVQEMPRDQWVKVRLINNKSQIPAKATWVNLRQVKAVSIVDPKDVQTEPRP